MAAIKKYENRRLYDTTGSRYVNLEDIARMVENGEDVVVTDVKSGRDLTREVLLQVVLESEEGVSALPATLLRRVIRTRGPDPLHRLVREQLALGLEILDAQLAQSEALLGRMASYEPTSEPMYVREPDPPPYVAAPPAPPFGAPAPSPADKRAGSPELAPEPAWRADPAGQAELTALRAELAKLEARLKR